MSGHEEILEYWFQDLDREDIEPRLDIWFHKKPETDAYIKERFERDVEAAARGERDQWMDSARPCLALILLLDQFTRNIYRDSPEAFAQDARALAAAFHALEKGFDHELPPMARTFVYLPLEHSEDMETQERSVKLFTALAGDAPDKRRETFLVFLDYAERHRAIIERFGRFPHRNSVLGRESTPEEIEFLKLPGSSF